MPVFTYTFHDLNIGDDVRVSGETDIVYRHEKDDPSVGFIGGIEYFASDIVLDTPDGEKNLNDNPELSSRVEKALMTHCDDAICEAAQDDFDKYGL